MSQNHAGLAQCLTPTAAQAMRIGREHHREDIMRQESIDRSRNQLLAVALIGIIGWLGTPGQAPAQSMSDYTNLPITINRTVEPNILFLVDMGNATLEAAYSGPGYYYPISYKATSLTYNGGTGYYAANTSLGDLALTVSNSGPNKDNCVATPTSIGTRAVSLSGTVLALTGIPTGSSLTPTACAAALFGIPIPEYTITNLQDTFDSATKYYGIFDSERCYTYGANSFQIGTDSSAIKGTGNYSATCPSTKWDGNFLNWLAMRKQEIIQKVLVGGSGHTIPAQANLDGTANSLAGEPETGENGATSTCGVSGGTVTACWRYVKYVPHAGLAGRVPTSLPEPVTVISGGAAALRGIFFGAGEGKIYVNDNAGINPFDTAIGNQYNIKVDLTSEPDVPSGTGSYSTSSTCDPGDTANFAGQRVCYQRSQSLGLFQTMQQGNMHVAVMMVNASTGKGGSLFYGFDEAYNASVVATLRNKKVEAQAPLAESLYEALCLFRKSQGPCYSNSGSAASWGTNYTNTINTTSDPFYYVKYGKMVNCCKNYVLMISPGIGIADGNNPDLATPFLTGATINPAWANNIGVRGATSSDDATSAAAGDRLDDIAFFGRTNDLRTDLGGSQYVTFYGVNALGRSGGARLLASAAANGGFVDKNGDNNTTHGLYPTSGQVCTYPAGSSLNPGTAGPFYSDPEWDSKKADGTDGADCVPDTFYDATNGEQLIKEIQNAINDILKNSSSGTSISVLASSSTGEGSIYQAYFYPEIAEGDRKVSWTGYLQGLFIDSFGNLREDRGGPSGASDGRLVYTEDNIITTTVDSTTNDVMVQRFADTDGNGIADSTTPYETVPLRSTQGLWEAGKKLALRDIAAKPRNLFAWVDKDNDGIVDSGEEVAFTTANATTFAPYLRAGTSGTYTAANIINFFQGNQVSGMRDRQLTVNGSLKVWRLGDIVNSSPAIIGPPRERFDILYGDTGYRQFLQRWKNRRLTAYVGGNDGMLHAFNVGYYHRGDDPTTTGTGEIEHGWYTTAPADNSSGPELGEELWGFIPHYILPQLIWYTQTNYTHVSYVDLKPKATDVRIFTPEAACGTSAAPTPTATGCIHPDGWGTILIVGMRFGGSCGACLSGTNNGGPPLSVTADFNATGTTSTRYFYSGYVVLDITDPEATAKVLTAYSSPTLGLTTSYPTVVRMSPKTDLKNDHANAVWSMVVGSGVHGYSGRAAAIPSLVNVTLVQQGTAPTVTVLPVGIRNGYMADSITYDKDLDFRSDVVYAGQTLDGSCYPGAPNPCSPLTTTNGTNRNNDPTNVPAGSVWWTGKLLRLTMGTCTASCSPSTWGVVSGGNRVPTEFVTQVPIGGTNKPLGPMSASPTVTLDNSGNTWVFFGTGRYVEAADKTDRHPQYLVGVKDSVMNACSQATTTDCLDENLLDVTNAAICISCASGTQVQGMGTTTTFTGLVDEIQGNSAAGVTAKDGWVIQLATNTGSATLGAERSVVNLTLIGGAIFSPTYTPDNDPCLANGSSQIYGLYYLTGTGHTDPIFGVDANGMANKSVNVGQGMASSMSVAIGGSPTSMTGICQSSNASFCLVKPKPPTTLWSQYLAWISLRA